MPEPNDYSPAYRCHLCDDVAVMGGLCEMHVKRWWR